MSVLFHFFTTLERHTNTYSFSFSFALKYCLGLFFTTALMTLAVEDFSLNNYYSYLYGVIEEETVMFFLTFFVVIYWLINPFQIMRLIKRKINHGRKDITQE